MFRNARVVGGELVDLPFPTEEEVDLEGAWVMPGLWDTHIHLGWWSLGLTRLELAGCPSREALLEAVRACEGKWVVGQGWYQDRWPDPRPPTREELDEWGGGRPVLLFRSDLHSAVASTAALAAAGFGPESPDPSGGRLDWSAGLAFELAVAPLNGAIPPPSHSELAAALRAGVAHLHRLGITGVVDQRLPEGEELPYDLYRELRLPLRIHCNRAPGQEFSSAGDDWVRPGHLKLFSDGSMGSRTARMLTGEGLWITPPERLRPHFVRPRSRLSIHAIGDEALRVVLDLFEEHGVVPGDRIEHVQLLSDADLGRLASLGIVASMQPVHLLDDEDLARRLLGDEARLYYRLGSLWRLGTRLGFGSDAPVASPDPWLGLQAAVRRAPPGRAESFYEEECLPVAAALAAYTDQACADLGWPEAGRLEKGCFADFVVLDRDPLTCAELAGVRVLRTVVGGKTVFQA